MSASSLVQFLIKTVHFLQFTGDEAARWLKWLEREFTDRKVRGSNPTSATRLPLSRLGRKTRKETANHLSYLTVDTMNK
ncbi:hypothetical protein T265_02375 [Opisthorchis viverrini]|uniref:Uncharacterized protein n=1 Tax=Opisthorchis viverrini TaxID=6198 RepID=A0A074ZZ85_OPIVI|nr:hypothetical protein T265_02375 [Opisthorchis viverrini]KER31317.1 hypothetical protein T265_02375 [Opisthorchis viverrini]